MQSENLTCRLGRSRPLRQDSRPRNRRGGHLDQARPGPHVPTGRRCTAARIRVDEPPAATGRTPARPPGHLPDSSNQQGDNDMNDIIEGSQIHATFCIERSYPVPVRRYGMPCRTPPPETVVQEVARNSMSRRSRTTSASVATPSKTESGMAAQVAVRRHLHRHRRASTDGVHLRHVGR